MMMGAWHRANLADDRADAAADERAECAQLLRLSNRELLLLAGEMTAQELRTVQAVLTNRAAVIMERPNVEVTGSPALSASPSGLPGYASGGGEE
jgi:hypothetical protein